MQYVKLKELVTVKFYRFSATRRRARARSGWPDPRGKVVKPFILHRRKCFCLWSVFIFECCVFFFFRLRGFRVNYLLGHAPLCASTSYFVINSTFDFICSELSLSFASNLTLSRILPSTIFQWLQLVEARPPRGRRQRGKNEKPLRFNLNGVVREHRHLR